MTEEELSELAFAETVIVTVIPLDEQGTIAGYNTQEHPGLFVVDIHNGSCGSDTVYISFEDLEFIETVDDE